MPSTQPNAMDNPEPMPVGEPEIGEPQGMTQDFNGDMGEIPDDMGNANSNSEIDDIFSKLDTEKQAAVIKYAKSMVDGNVDDAQNDNGNEMQNENAIVNEIANNILDDREKKPEDGEDKIIRNKKVTIANPFITKDFNNCGSK